ncbi:HET-domain-containing protein [Lophiostoma macrostomum CBS 122681]|uniref:HET-domain-containing protein n=1 Tax=Lophiostoma macrostomum CBS 122681 TaxID=1314788 RepID=A0A6A6TQ63_9PLEO|nr:HET-domain-containing protein [Lophiostoma macrostomum CBS 122681]
MLKREPSISSDDETEDETTQLLRSQGVCEERLKKFRATSKRIRRCVEAKSATGSFCSNCNLLTLADLRKGFQISDSFARLRQSSNHCQLCRLVVMSLRNKLPDIDAKLKHDQNTFRTVQLSFNDDGATDTNTSSFKINTIERVSLLETFWIHMDDDATNGVVKVAARVAQKVPGAKGQLSRGLIYIDSFIMAYTKDPQISKIRSLPLDPRPKSDNKFALMKSWLEEDRNKETEIYLPPMYNRVKETVVNPVPSRLIHIPRSNDEERCRLRLIDTQSLLEADFPPYIALSHRWGLTHSFITTVRSLQTRQAGFDLQELPKTYRDAALVVSRLGFEYLWIDAICIVQDDNDDWLCESEKMGIIYRSAVFTIANHCSENDDGGFLEAALQRRGSIKFNAWDTKQTYLRSAADLELDVSKSPLSKRSWILQERFLSTRVLHFTIGMIYLETSHGVRSEDGWTPADAMRLTVDSANLLTAEQFMYRKPLSLQRFSHYLSDNSADQDSPMEWFSLLEMYSTCSLTKERDKLPALFGIVRAIQHAHWVYLAGIWKDRLYMGLMWMNVGEPLKKPSFERASSWSWAAYDGPVQFPLLRFSLPYSVVCNFVHANLENPSWLNGPGALTVEVDVLDLSPVLKSRDLFISLYREELHPTNAKAWEKADQAIFQDPALSIFNVYNARRFLWMPASSTSESLDCIYTPDHPGPPPPRSAFPRGEGSWIVFDSEDEVHNQQAYLDLLFVSLAFFNTIDIERKPVTLRMGIFISPVEGQKTYRRVGAGLLRSTLVETMHQVEDWKFTFDRREITLV